MSKIFKRAAALLLAIMLCLTASVSAFATDYPCTGYALRMVGALNSTQKNGGLLFEIPAGDAVYVTGESDNYYIVEYDGQSGYVLKDAIRLSGESGKNPETGDWTGSYTVLYPGDSGTAVKELQEALIELKFLSGKADGKYGTKTGNAVKAFQEKNGLNDSGCADAATQGLLFEKKVKNSAGKSVLVTIVPSVSGVSIISGKAGSSVKTLQSALKNLGFYTGTIDGKYGTSTANAVKKFQKKNNLTVTGEADAATQSLLYSGSALSSKATATPTPTATPVPQVIGWENGVPSSTSQATYPFETTTTAAVNLRSAASTSSSRKTTIPKGAGITVLSMTGDWLKVFYSAGSKNFTGYVMANYVDVPAEYLGGSELETSAEAQKKYTALSSGASGRTVSALQSALKELGFYSADITGTFDVVTQVALKSMQKKNGLLQTGIASAELQQLIYEGKPLNSKGKKTSVSVLPPISGVTMQKGDSGYQVTELQEALIALGYLNGNASGIYDNATVTAVKALQKAAGLTADGIAGTKTQAQISAYLTTPTPYVAVVTPTPTPITKENVIIIQKGTRGLCVTRLQERLVELGYYTATADGIYNANDITALKAFQKKNGLTADGIAGYDTQILLYSDAAVPSWATATPKPSATPKPTATVAADTSVTLQIGSSGTQVNLLQARLTTLGYFDSTIDGIFGTQTARAVAAFQSANSLTSDGIAGPKTLKKLYATSAKKATATATPSPAPTATASPASTVLKVGSKGSDVKSAQNALITLGYLTGAADGIYGTKTYLAVRAFQKANNLTADGQIGEKTLARLVALAEEETGETASGSSTSTVTGTTFKAPSASEVRFADWYLETRAVVRQLPNAIIYDYATGLHYNVTMFSFGKHADAEPVTASDTAIMRQIMGTDNWTPHAVWVILSDGRVYMASTHSYGHQVDHNSSNNLTGHICIHFPREMSETEKETMPYALRHQNEILRGWEETQSMIQ